MVDPWDAPEPVELERRRTADKAPRRQQGPSGSAETAVLPFLTNEVSHEEIVDVPEPVQMHLSQAGVGDDVHVITRTPPPVRRRGPVGAITPAPAPLRDDNAPPVRTPEPARLRTIEPGRSDPSETETMEVSFEESTLDVPPSRPVEPVLDEAPPAAGLPMPVLAGGVAIVLLAAVAAFAYIGMWSGNDEAPPRATVEAVEQPAPAVSEPEAPAPVEAVAAEEAEPVEAAAPAEEPEQVAAAEAVVEEPVVEAEPAPAAVAPRPAKEAAPPKVRAAKVVAEPAPSPVASAPAPAEVVAPVQTTADGALVWAPFGGDAVPAAPASEPTAAPAPAASAVDPNDPWGVNK